MCEGREATEILARVRAAGRGLEGGEAQAALEALIADTEAPTSPEGRLARLAVGALVARRAGAAADTGNLYGGEAGPAEMIAAFEAFVQHTPLPRFAHAAANAAHLALLDGAQEVCILDIGLGAGGQWVPLLQALGQARGGPPRLHLIGNDLPSPGPRPGAALEAAGERLAAVAAAAGVPFTFTALPGRVEEVALPVARPGERLVVNAAFVLHHTAGAERDRALRRLVETGAAGIVLAEPEADHDAPDFPARLDAALRHYGLLFRVLDRCLADRPAARAVIEGQFFGRELHNVLVGEGTARVERHAPWSDWSARLRAAGLVPCAAAPVQAPALPPGVAVQAREGGHALTVDGQAIVVVSAWRPVERPAGLSAAM